METKRSLMVTLLPKQFSRFVERFEACYQHGKYTKSF